MVDSFVEENFFKCSYFSAEEFNEQLKERTEICFFTSKSCPYKYILIVDVIPSFMPTITLTSRISDNSATCIDNIFWNKQNFNFQSGLILEHITDHLPVFLAHTSEGNLENGILNKQEIETCQRVT